MSVESETLETVVRAYLVCALWSTTGDNGEPLDASCTLADFSPAQLQQARAECAAFCTAHPDALRRLGAKQVGHDLWLTRNRHGGGFWDRGLGTLGAQLAAAARTMGGRDLYIGDDRQLHFAQA